MCVYKRIVNIIVKSNTKKKEKEKQEKVQEKKGKCNTIKIHMFICAYCVCVREGDFRI